MTHVTEKVSEAVREVRGGGVRERSEQEEYLGPHPLTGQIFLFPWRPGLSGRLAIK